MDELRKLDLEVAERVMGFDCSNARIDPMNRDGEPQYHMGYPIGHDFAPFYSTDIAAAFAVIGKLFMDGFVISLHADGVDKLYRCNVTTPKPRCEHFYEEASVAPEAICRAALKAIAKG